MVVEKKVESEPKLEQNLKSVLEIRTAGDPDEAEVLWTDLSPNQIARAVADLVRQHEAAAIVVGLPLNMDGTAGAQAEKVRAFVDGLKRHTSVPIVERDERLTTVEAHEILRKSGVAWGQRAALLDKVSAVVILQEYLDERRAGGAGPAS